MAAPYRLAQRKRDSSWLIGGASGLIVVVVDSDFVLGMARWETLRFGVVAACATADLSARSWMRPELHPFVRPSDRRPALGQDGNVEHEAIDGTAEDIPL